MSHYHKWLISLAVSILSGMGVMYYFLGRLANGDVSAWAGAAISFVVFGVSAPMAVYYKSRRYSKSIEEKLQEAIDQESQKIQEVDNDKR